ncbi:hypothetical protein PGQ11_011025 [Apiospora arundinis]|uniref:Uncharacterized protein n=1 Tax=Apiospora arundinis TaxID=335852 RepID=A0ABR2HYC2_9PEZI
MVLWMRFLGGRDEEGDSGGQAIGKISTPRRSHARSVLDGSSSNDWPARFRFSQAIRESELERRPDDSSALAVADRVSARRNVRCAMGTYDRAAANAVHTQSAAKSLKVPEQNPTHSHGLS